ncbi:Tyrosine--tRNA ligase [bacterium HR40]|nr:Tyrosine--tRNA ligase [bacterium HR40]
MVAWRSEFLKVLHERGFVHQCTDAETLDELAAKQPITGYVGFDCTADSLHAGHLISIMMLRWLQRTGHRPIALVGGGTTKVGDPSGKDEARPLLSDAEIERNKAGIRRNLERFLDFERGALLVDNAAWLDGLLYIPFLREYGRHFTINRMLTFDSVRLRLEREQPLTFLEFNYMVMQAYDFLELWRRFGCRLQMGGSDQWGNIVCGIELTRRVEGVQLFGLTCRLLTTASGAKMGKTAQGAVWLDPAKLSPFDYWQYWRNTEDRDVGRFLRLFTELPLSEIERLERLAGAELNEAKKILAFEQTRLVHGEEEARRAAAAAQALFEGGGGDRAAIPVVEVPRTRFVQGIRVAELLRLAGLAPSNSEARRLIRGGGARLDGRRLEDEQLVLGPEFAEKEEIELSAGRKRHVRVRVI